MILHARRMTARILLVVGPAAAVAASAGAATSATSPDWHSDIAQIEQAYASHAYDPHALTAYFLQRIRTIDQSGPALHAVIETNPDALAIADKLPQNAGALYGIPVLVKDNLDTADSMQTTAGSLAMVGQPASQDSTVVSKLRGAGAVLLGKTNLSEWANYRSTHSTSGWSGRGGLTRNPYALDRNACGSSSGSAVAVAAGLATVAIGTETDGSIVCPSAINGVVGIKPTLGLVSRAGIVPISHSQDTAGPITRTVADAARVLTVIAGSDPRDPATAPADSHKTDYTRFLDANALKGKRIGVVRKLAGYDPNTDRVLDDAVAALRRAGAIVIDPVKIPHLDDYGDAEGVVLSYEFKHDLNAYLATRKGLPVHTLADLIAWDKAHADTELQWFGQELFERAQKRGPLTDKKYREALAKCRKLAGPEGIDAALRKHHLDALLAPTVGPAWTTDLINGDHTTGGSSSPAAVAGYPDITVPAGYVHGLPVGVSFFAGKWSEPKLIGIAYAFEQATHARRDPEFRTTVTQ
ncbi:MAG TPA: amidase [Rhodanobacteraceae bacterium]|nr:amidase [Rhodanobacteraceae bacterium]